MPVLPNSPQKNPNLFPSLKDKQAGFNYLEHTADVWVHAWGTSLEDTFSQCVYALMDTMIESNNIAPREIKEIMVKDQTIGALLINFLSEFLFLFDTEGWLVGEVNIAKIEKNSGGEFQLHAVVKGETFNPQIHEPDTEVKAITYSYLEIQNNPGHSEIKIVYDI